MKALALAFVPLLATLALAAGPADAAPRWDRDAGYAERLGPVDGRGGGHIAVRHGRFAVGTPLINRRIANQQHRIRHGARIGDLTPRESRRLRARLGDIRYALRAARRDGRVTPYERRRILAMLNRNSEAIARLRHNRRARY